MADRIVFAGPVFGAAKTLLYRKAACLVLASYSENFGNVVLEAMVEGCPVIVTPEVGAATAVIESGGGVVVSGGAREIAGAVREMLASTKKRKEVGARGQNWVVERYSWESVAGRMLAMYESVIESHATARTA